MSADTGERIPGSRRRWLALLPLAIFLGLVVMFLIQLLSGRENSVVPSALIGEPAPQMPLPPLKGSGVPGLEASEFSGGVTLVNVWASWCAPCRVEHPLLMQLASDERVTIVGMNYKDKRENALRFLGALGNPYDAIGVDNDGRVAIDWGVYGVPETFLVGKDGRIAWKHVGPFTPESIENGLIPEIENALAAN